MEPRSRWRSKKLHNREQRRITIKNVWLIEDILLMPRTIPLLHPLERKLGEKWQAEIR